MGAGRARRPCQPRRVDRRRRCAFVALVQRRQHVLWLQLPAAAVRRFLSLGVPELGDGLGTTELPPGRADAERDVLAGTADDSQTGIAAVVSDRRKLSARAAGERAASA